MYRHKSPSRGVEKVSVSLITTLNKYVMAVPEVIYIVDMDGFYVSGNFLCKEMSWIRLSDLHIETRYFRVADKPLRQLEPRDQKAIRYVTKRVHGMTFSDWDTDLPQYDIGNILLGLAKDASQQGGVIGYKGGVVERDWLRKLNITNHLDIERPPYYCPRYEVLRDTFDEDGSLTGLRCRRHPAGGPNTHCPAQEVHLFAQHVLSIASVNINFDSD